MAEDKWNVKGLRGSVLEELINYTNEKYRQQKLALVQKIPTSIKPVRFDKTKRHITLAILIRKVLLIILGLCREFLFALMQKNVQKTYSHFRIFMNIR